MALSLGVSAVRSLVEAAATTVCATGVVDCSIKQTPTCAPYNGDYKDPEGNYVILIFTIIFAAAMAFAIGGNDGANAWATSIHSFAITLRPACLLAGVFEILGASTLGYGVSSSIQKGISNLKDPECFACGYCDSSMSLYYVGMMAALIGASTFLITATYFRMPVSTTHAIVSAVLGMTVAYHGFGCVQWGWKNMGGIIASWVISPVFSGVVCLIVYYVTYYFIFASRIPRTRAFIALPFLYFVVVFVVVFLSFIKAPVTKSHPKWQGVVAGVIAGGACAAVVVIFLFPFLRKNLPSINEKNRLDLQHLMLGTSDEHSDNPKTPVPGEGFPGVEIEADKKDIDAAQQIRDSHVSLVDADPNRASLQVVAEYEALSEEQQDAMWMFKYVLILVACLQSFAHGSNDTANATAALSAVINGFNNGLNSCSTPETPWWIMFLGGTVLAIGILVWGYKVMTTIGRDICIVNFHRAFCTEFASSLTVVIASLMNLPISSTHCQVGAVIFVSVAACGVKRVKWSLVSTVFATWFCTLPFAALVAALFAYLFGLGMKN